MDNKKIISEKLSVSDNVIQLTDICYNKFCEQVNVENINYSQITCCAYNEGVIKIPTNGLLKTIEELTIKYTIYIVKNLTNYYYIEQYLNNFCYASYDDKKIEIETVFLIEEHKFVNDVKSIFSHGIGHLFQEDCGFKPSVNNKELYSKLLDYKKDSAKDKLLESVWKCLYYSFAHEQDAFAHQFYSYLKNKKSVGEFGDEIELFGNYVDFYNSLYNLLQIDSNKLNQILYSYGLTVNQFWKRVNFAHDRFAKKLSNAYKCYSREKVIENLNPLSFINNGIRLNERLSENYKTYTIQYEDKFCYGKLLKDKSKRLI